MSRLLFKARGNTSFGLLLLRLTLGAYTLILGASQATHIEQYISKIKAMGMFSENFAFIMGFTAPFLMIIFGAALMMGFFTPPTSFILAAIQLIKIFSRGFFPSEGIPFNKDIILFICFALIFFAGAGVFSFDALIDRKKKEEEKIKTATATITTEVVTDKGTIADKTEEIKTEEVKTEEVKIE